MKLMELYQEKIMGAISGLDRIRFRGTLRWLAHESGIRSFLHGKGLLLKDVKSYFLDITSKIRRHCEEACRQADIETIYLNSSKVDKEDLARRLAQEKGIREGAICNISIVEQCFSPRVKGNKATKKLELKVLPSKCVHLYRYFNHSEFGFGHVRLQSWAPYNIMVCLNGRHWLERQLQKHQIKYVKDGNCFPWIEDIERAQHLLDQQLQADFSAMLNGLARELCPDLDRILPLQPQYYWSVNESEWATDIMFNHVADLDRLYPWLIYHAMKSSDSSAVMRFLGRADYPGPLSKEVISDVRRRYEGVRIKHWRNQNSVKMYNKSGSILRVETTINHTREFKVYRHPNDDSDRPKSWLPMRKGIGDLHRRCQVSQQCNERYADALAAAQVEETLKEVAQPACNKVVRQGKKYRGLNPWQSEDCRLLRFLSQGEYALNGFRNRDLRQWLYRESKNQSQDQQRKYSGRVTRRIKLLRVHGLIRKVAGENRYVLTAKGQKFATALKVAGDVDVKGLMEMVA